LLADARSWKTDNWLLSPSSKEHTPSLYSGFPMESMDVDDEANYPLSPKILYSPQILCSMSLYHNLDGSIGRPLKERWFSDPPFVEREF